MSTNPTDPLQQPLDQLSGLSPARLEQLQRLGLTTVRDLLFHFPRTYEDLSDVRPISGLTPGSLQTAQGEVVEIEGRRLADGRSLVSLVLSDGSNCLEGVWFNQPFIGSRYRFGQLLTFSGKPRWFRDHWQMANPRIQLLEGAGAEESPHVLPIYPLTEDLRQDQLRSVLRRIVKRFADKVPEILPDEVRQHRGLPIRKQAIQEIHFPPTLAAAQRSRQRFVYEEFLILQLALALRRRELRDRQRAPLLTLTPQIDVHIRRLFPFRFTADQERVIADVCHDLANDRPMQRLLQADVGAGKTVVAIYALLVAVANKYQAVLMAPTEILARQHAQTLDGFLSASRVRRLLLTGNLKGRERKSALEAIRLGQVDLVVGTHALVQDDVQFSRLGLVVIDEQHKFGVDQRARVRRLGVDAHYLVMTATPIPRTVALTVFGDLDTSIIRQMPPGRQPVMTRWVPVNQRERVYESLREGLRQGRQAFVVCPLVAESETLDLKAAEQTFAELKTGSFRDFRLGLLHGKLEEELKTLVMEQFRLGHLDLLVTTSIIEVGVDIPNATLLVVEHADRFGLSQLHQLRGRISRGDKPGQCYLFAEAATDQARDRLRALTRTTDGFALAELDARLRGLGEFFGTRQHGLGEMTFANLLTDRELLFWARQDAIALISADAGLRLPAHHFLRRMVLKRFGQTLDLAEIG